MINSNLPINIFSIFHVVFINSHVLQTMTSLPLAIPIISAFAPGSELCICGINSFAGNGVLDEPEIGGQDGFVDFIYDCDGVFGVCGKGADLAPVAGRALLFEGLGVLVLCLLTLLKTLYCTRSDARKQEWREKGITNRIFAAMILKMPLKHFI